MLPKSRLVISAGPGVETSNITVTKQMLRQEDISSCFIDCTARIDNVFHPVPHFLEDCLMSKAKHAPLLRD